MPRTQASPIQKLTTLFLDLDGGDMEVALEIFKAIQGRRMAQLTAGPQKVRVKPAPKAVTFSAQPATTPSGAPLKRPVKRRAKPLAPPVQLPIVEAAEPAEYDAEPAE